MTLPEPAAKKKRDDVLAAKINAVFGAEIARKTAIAKEKSAKIRKRDEEIFQRATCTYMNMNFTYFDEDKIRRQQFPFFAVRNEIAPPRDGVDPQEWAMRQGAKAKAMGVLAGVTDWHTLCNGKYRVIELKVPGGNVSKSQKRFMADVITHGGEAYVVWNMGEFHAIISEFATPRYDPPACNARSKKLMTQEAVAKEMWNDD